ncbi:MAG: 1-acyl-sn-glycerol-3-phosphate acyltransferase [Gammaproteobacteria bacterium]|jgi:1-acyl-sn-glycerol-3-phosphate acyltransferase
MRRTIKNRFSTTSIGAASRTTRAIGHLRSAKRLTKKLSGQEPPIHTDLEVSRSWQAKLVHILGTQILVRGEVPDGAALLAINHVSWIDPVIVGTMMPVRFVAKAQSQRWPVIGSLLSAIGTVFIVRGGPKTGEVVKQMADTLKAGVAVGFFPEATTTHGRRVGYMFPRLFKAALDNDIPIVPVSIRYSRSARGRDSAPYIDDMKFLPHIIGMLRDPPVTVELEFLPAVSGAGRDDIANQVRNSILRSLSLSESTCQKRDPLIDFKQLWYDLRFRLADGK